MKSLNSLRVKLGPKQIFILGSFIICVVVPYIMSPFQTELLSKFMVFGLVALSYDLIWGFAGITNFGHAVFFGSGAYAFGLVSKNINIPGVTYLAILAAIIVPMLIGIFLSIFLHHGKVAGAFFAIVTLVLGAAFESIAMAWTNVTGGMNGLYNFATPKLGIPGVWEFELSGFAIPYYLIFISLVFFLFLTWWIMKKRDFGKVISAIKNNENRLEYLGYNVNLFKTIIFAISCGIAGFAGALYVLVSTITPSVLGIGMSIQILVWVAVGGRGSLWGAIAGAVIVSAMRELLSGLFLDFWLLIIGIFFILVVILWPMGFAGLCERIGQIFSKKKRQLYLKK
ncbi:MAG: branched-chain amino acid ABC transporter permease [Candidatus Humimicrobiaceae bacterium]